MTACANATDAEMDFFGYKLFGQALRNRLISFIQTINLPASCAFKMRMLMLGVMCIGFKTARFVWANHAMHKALHAYPISHAINRHAVNRFGDLLLNLGMRQR